MSSPTPIQPFYRPISFVSPISDTTHSHHHNSNGDHPSRLRRLSTYLKNAVTFEDHTSASRRESIISDHMKQQAEWERRTSMVSAQDEQEDRALLAWRRGSEEGFWKKYGSIGSEGGRRKSSAGDVYGRRKSSVVNEEGEVPRRGSVAERLGMRKAKGNWRRMSWGKNDGA
jgi:hypothetical protein